MSDGPIEICILGKIPSKKNAYTPRRDKPGMFKNSRLQSEIDRLAVQLPGDIRGLRLVSPDIDLYLTCQKFNSDRDNKLTTILDLLVNYEILAGDSLAQCNGRITVHPAARGEYDETRIILTPRA